MTLADDPADVAADVLRTLDARAAGLWRADGSGLVQLAFVAADDMPPEVAAGFAAATRALPLDRVDLGVVRAAVTGLVAVSIARDLPADAGSGKWLRAFGAEHSVAVPIVGPDGRVGHVLSVAVGAGAPDSEAVAELLRAYRRT